MIKALFDKLKGEMKKQKALLLREGL